MADPLSIAASIAGVITIADTVFSRTAKYVKSAKNARSEVVELAREISLLAGILHSLSSLAGLLEQEQFDHSLRIDHISICDATLTKIDKRLKEAERNFESGSKVEILQRQLKWPFSSKDTKEWLAELSRHKETLNLALTADSMNTLLRHLSLGGALRHDTSEILDRVNKTHEITSRISHGSERQKVFDFFMKVNPQPNYEMSLKLRHPRTGLWLLRTPEFQTWLSTPGSRLWFTGIPGAGKTVLTGSIIEAALRQSSESIGVAFFFCDYKNPSSHMPVNVLGALVSQLALQKEEAYDIMQRYFDDLHPRRGLPKCPSVDGLQTRLKEMVELFDHVFIVLDGLDECVSHTEDVADILSVLAKDLTEISIAILSRDEYNIRYHFEHDFRRVEIAANTEDITEYVSAQIEERIRRRRLFIRDPQLKGEIVDRLVDGAKGMFRWVACQLDHLCELTSDQERWEALQKLPPDLTSTYMRILERIPKSQSSLVQRTLQLIAYAEPKLSIRQLCEVLSTPKNGGTLTPRGMVSEDEISLYCGSFIRKSTDGNYFEFAHFSVREFLTSETLADSAFDTYLISQSRCEKLLAVQSLHFLQLENFSRTPTATHDEIDNMAERNQAHPFYEYASRYWLHCARDHWDDQEVVDLAKCLFDPRKTAQFTVWSLEFCRQFRIPEWFDTSELEDYVELDDTIELFSELIDEDFTPLHLAAMLALPVICRHLIEGNAEIDLKSPMGTPLACSCGGLLHLSIFEVKWFLSCFADFPSFGHHSKTIKVLLEAGASLSKSGDEMLVTNAMVLSDQLIDFSPVISLLEAGVELCQHDLDTCSKIFESWADVGFELDVLNSRLEPLLRCLNASPLSAAPLTFDLSSLVWKQAISWGLDLVEDHSLVDTRISLSEDALALKAISAIQEDTVEALKTLILDPRLKLPAVVDEDGLSLLHLALKWSGEPAVLKLLLDRDCSPFKPDPRGNLPIHLWKGYMDGNGDLLRLLAEYKGTIDMQDANGSNLLHLHVDHPSTLKMLLGINSSERTTAALNATNNHGYTPLFSAVKHGVEDSVKLLLDHSDQDPASWQHTVSILQLAAESGSKSVFQLLLDAGVEPNVGMMDGGSPLHYIKRNASVECVQLIKSLNEDACWLRFESRLPVELYLRDCLVPIPPCRPDDEIIKEFILTNCLETKSTDFKMLWEYVTTTLLREFQQAWSSDKHCQRIGTSAFASAITCLVQQKVMDCYEAESEGCGFSALLMPYGQDRDYGTMDDYLPVSSEVFCQTIEQTQRWPEIGGSPAITQLLKAAVASGDIALVKLLLKKGASVHDRIKGISPIEKACKSGISGELFQLLLDHAEGNRLDEVGPSSLGLVHYLAESKSAFMTDELMKRGANPSLRTGVYPHSPALVYHLMANSFESAEVLLRCGADPSLACNGGIDAALAAAACGGLSFLTQLSQLKAYSEKQSWQKRCTVTLPMKENNRVVARVTALHLASFNGHTECLRFYTDQDNLLDVNSTAADLSTPMHFGAAGGHVDTIKFLHSQGASINPRNALGNLPLHVAVLYGNIAAVEALLELGSQHDANEREMTPLLLACMLGNERIVECLRRKLDSEHTGDRPANARSANPIRSDDFAKSLESAIRNGDLVACKELRRLGCCLNLELSSCACPPLIHAIGHNKSNIITWLLENGALVTKAACKQHENFTTVSSLLQRGQLNSILPALLQKYLKDGGRSFSQPRNVFSVAIEAKNTAGLKIVIDHIRENAASYGARTGIAPCEVLSRLANNNDNKYDGLMLPPLSLAAISGNDEAARLLIEVGADVCALDPIYGTPLHAAACAKNDSGRSIATSLIHSGAAIESRGRHGYTPLMLACNQGNIRLAETLIRAGADIRAEAWEKISLLSILALQMTQSREISDASLKLFLRLCQRGLDPHAEDINGRSPMHLAMRGPPQLCSLLLNGDLGIENTSPFPWNSAVFGDRGDLLWLSRRFRLYRRRLSFESLQRILNLQPRFGWSPLCRAASLGMCTTMENLLSMGAALDYEGCPEGSALMVACLSGRLESVRFLVRKGAAISYMGLHQFRCALVVGQCSKDIMHWLLVERFTDQRKLDGGQAWPTADTVLKRWSSIGRIELSLTEHTRRRRTESLREYCSRMSRLKRDLLGQVVPPAPENGPACQSQPALVPNEIVRVHPDDRRTPREEKRPRIYPRKRVTQK